MEPTSDSTTSDSWVICLCAEWCGVCREWREIFTRTAAAHPELRFAWVDVEDEAEAMADVDVETFPTLLIARSGQPVFFGPLQPSAAQLSRLLASLPGNPAADGAFSAEAKPLLARLAVHVLPKP